METLVVFSAGIREVREYALAAMAARHRIVLIDFQPAMWVTQYVHAFHRLAPPASLDQMLEDVKQIIHQEQATGIATYDDRYVGIVARVAEELGLPGAGRQATLACKDKWEARKRLASTGVGAVKAQLVSTPDEAVAAAASIGVPVVLKPRALGGSVGVVRVDQPEGVRAAFEVASGGSFPGLVASLPGVLVEEYIEGDEFSIDCLVYNGRVYPLFVAAKLVGFPPYFEELGHVVTADGLERLPGIRDFLQSVHEALGFRNGVTHVEIRVTPQGYKIMEVNPRLGGDLIPYLGWQATGIDLAAAVADVALGREPDLRATRSGAAAVRFIYPERDMTLQAVSIPEEIKDDPNVLIVRALEPPGTSLALPPRGFLSRVAMVAVKGEDTKHCLDTIARTIDRISIVG